MIFAVFDVSPLKVCMNCSFFTFITPYNLHQKTWLSPTEDQKISYGAMIEPTPVKDK